MKKRTFTFALLGSLLVGCASHQPSEYTRVLDAEKMGKIEATTKAYSSSITTYWVNPPKKKVKRKNSDDN